MHPDPRHLQANERTLLAWSRTGLALMAFGFVIDRMALWFRYELHREEGGSLILGSLAIGLGAACQVVGAIRFVAMRRALLAGSYVQHVASPLVVVMLVALLGFALLLFVLLA